MRRGRVRAGLLAFVVLATGSACAEAPRMPAVGLTGGWETAGCELTAAPVITATNDRAAPKNERIAAPGPQELQAAIGRIEHGGSTEYRASFAGVDAEAPRERAIVYRVPSAEFDDFIRIKAQNSCIVVRDALHGLDELTEWHDRVTADLPMWSAKGITIASVAGRHDGFGVEISTHQVDRARAELQAHYGDTAPLIYIDRDPLTPPPAVPPPLTPPPDR